MTQMVKVTWLDSAEPMDNSDLEISELLSPQILENVGYLMIEAEDHIVLVGGIKPPMIGQMLPTYDYAIAIPRCSIQKVERLAIVHEAVENEMKTKQLTPACVEVRMKANKTDEWEQWFLLSSDRHHDNAHTNQKLEKRHLEQAVERGAGIIDVGDMHCAMQSKEDRRQNRGAMRDENAVEEYFDSLVDSAIDFYAPYAHNFILISEGNHETAVRKKWGTCLTTRTVKGLNQEAGSKIHKGGYGGWINFVIERHGSRHRFRLKFFHGSGGGGPVTRGVIQTNRMAVYLLTPTSW